MFKPVFCFLFQREAQVQKQTVIGSPSRQIYNYITPFSSVGIGSLGFNWCDQINFFALQLFKGDGFQVDFTHEDRNPVK